MVLEILIQFYKEDLESCLSRLTRKKVIKELHSTLSNSNTLGIAEMFELQKARMTEIRITEVFC